ncbi:unnamed protein product [Prunus armeniaca]
MQKVGKLDTQVNGQSIQPVSSSAQITEMTAVQDHTKRNNTTRKQEVKASVQELASRATSRVKAVAAEKITPPNSAYQFEAISPSALPQIFKNALTVPILLDIINEEMDLAVNYLDNLTRVPRFDTFIMFLSSSDNDAMHASSSIPISMWYISLSDCFISYTNPITLQTDVVKIWDEVLDNEATPIEYAEKLDNLHTKYYPKR